MVIDCGARPMMAANQLVNPDTTSGSTGMTGTTAGDSLVARSRACLASVSSTLTTRAACADPPGTKNEVSPGSTSTVSEVIGASGPNSTVILDNDGRLVGSTRTAVTALRGSIDWSPST